MDIQIGHERLDRELKQMGATYSLEDVTDDAEKWLCNAYKVESINAAVLCFRNNKHALPSLSCFRIHLFLDRYIAAQQAIFSAPLYPMAQSA